MQIDRNLIVVTNISSSTQIWPAKLVYNLEDIIPNSVTCGWVTSHMGESCHTWVGHVTCGFVMSHVGEQSTNRKTSIPSSDTPTIDHLVIGKLVTVPPSYHLVLGGTICVQFVDFHETSILNYITPFFFCKQKFSNKGTIAIRTNKSMWGYRELRCNLGNKNLGESAVMCGTKVTSILGILLVVATPYKARYPTSLRYM